MLYFNRGDSIKTLVINSSPRRDGFSQEITNLVQENIENVEVLNTYELKNIVPCDDCRYCYEINSCIKKDEIQEIYKLIEESDAIVIVSPIYFNGLPGMLKIIIDRFQYKWSGRIRGDYIKEKNKKGYYFLIGGAPAYNEQFIGSVSTIRGFYNEINTELILGYEISNSDKIKISKEDEKKIKKIIWKIKENY